MNIGKMFVCRSRLLES